MTLSSDKNFELITQLIEGVRELCGFQSEFLKLNIFMKFNKTLKTSAYKGIAEDL